MTAIGVGGDVDVCRAVVGGVVDEVGDGPIKLVGIDGGHEVAGAMHADGPAVGGGPVPVRDAVQQRGDRDGYDRRPVPVVGAGEQQEVFGEGDETVGVGQRAAQRGVGLGGAAGAAQGEVEFGGGQGGRGGEVGAGGGEGETLAG